MQQICDSVLADLLPEGDFHALDILIHVLESGKDPKYRTGENILRKAIECDRFAVDEQYSLVVALAHKLGFDEVGYA
jgi:hypothetical protein